MAWIKIVEPEAAEGPLKQEYESALKRAGSVANILKVQSLNPTTLNRCIEFYKVVMFGESALSREDREMLATVVSQTNRCFY
ncbi:MAG: carboxymuconolactone decarboxylase family protein [Planctomycetota bacterium]